jgi:hypothetical protein
MSFGIAIQTQLGLVALGGLKTAQEVATFLATTENGQVSTPAGVTPSNGGALVEILDGKNPPRIFIRADGLTVWTNFAPVNTRSTNFRIRWVRYR